MADNSGGAEGGIQVSFSSPPGGSGLDGNDPDSNEPIPAIDPAHGVSERYITRNVFPISEGRNDPFGRFDDGDRPSISDPGEPSETQQSIAPPAPKMPINHGHDSLSGDEVIYS